MKLSEEPAEFQRVAEILAAKKIQSKLKAACYGTTPQVLFSRWDKDGGGTLDAAELKKLVRAGLKIPPKDLPDKDINLLVQALDDDGNGNTAHTTRAPHHITPHHTT